jgi:hypothetical protein
MLGSCCVDWEILGRGHQPRESDLEDGATLRGCLDCYVATVQADDFAHDHKAETHSAELEWSLTMEGLEYPLARLGRDPDPVVSHR